MQPGTLSNVWIVTHRQPVKLVELKNETRKHPGSCRWPVGPLDQKTQWFCGAPAIWGCPYCEFHDAIAHRATPKVDLRLEKVI